MVGTTHSWDVMESICQRVHNGEFKTKIAAETGISTTTIVKYYRKWCAKKDTTPVPPKIYKPPKNPPPEAAPNSPRLLVLDIETLPNLGFFFDTYSDRAIALDFIVKPKAVCTIAWKFIGDAEAKVICAHEPYNDKAILEEILHVFGEADYVIWHFGEGFDRKFLEGRLFANGLHALPPVASIDTYKLAKAKWGKTLNSNKLDHLAKLCGVGQKNKTDAKLWVRCAQGDIDALQEMALYNQQDVNVLEAVYKKLAPNVKSKVNHNILHDDAVLRCNPCGSSNLELKGYELTASTLRHRYQCNDCKAWTLKPRKKNDRPPQDSI